MKDKDDGGVVSRFAASGVLNMLSFSYRVHVFCDECGVHHDLDFPISAGIDATLDRRLNDLYDLYEGREVPADLIVLQSNHFECPTTGKPFTQKNTRQVFLIRTA